LNRILAIRIFAPVAFLVLLIAGWQVAIDVFEIPPFFLPTPAAVWAALGTYADTLWKESLYTLGTTLAGFGFAVAFGLGLGLLIGASRTLYSGIYPLMIGFNAIPKVAVVPILALWFGTGEIPAIVTAFLISFFPIVVNVATGLATIEPEMEDVLRALGGSKLDIMRKVGIPRALPYFFASLKVAITLAFVGSVIAESSASNHGIGHLMLQAQAQFVIPLVYACLVVLAVQGILMYAVMAVIERRMTGWAHRSGFATG
jgi:NitT/TauT family transport system permease protein